MGELLTLLPPSTPSIFIKESITKFRITVFIALIAFPMQSYEFPWYVLLYTFQHLTSIIHPED